MRGKLGFVSRVQPFDPASVAGLTGWWDASDQDTLFDATSGGSLVAADGGVARLEDKSGNGRHFTQSSSGSRPIRKTGVRNSLDVLRFDGSDDVMDSSTSFGTLFTSTQTTCFIVAKATNAGTNDSFQPFNSMVLSDTNAGQGFFAVRSNNTARSFGYDGDYSDASVAYTIGDWVLFSTWHDGTDLNVSLNSGTAVSTNLDTRTSLGTMRLGANYANIRFDGDVAEVITYNQTLPENDRENVQSHLISKWGI